MNAIAVQDRALAADQAYRRAHGTRTAVRRRIDILDEPVLDYGAARNPKGGRRSEVLPPPPAWVPRGPERLEHSLAAPTTTALKLGFGFAAGAALFRLLVLAGVGALGFVLLAALLAEAGF